MVDHERTDYQPLRVRINGVQRCVYVPQITTTNNCRRRNRRRQSRNTRMYISRDTSPMQWEDGPQRTSSPILTTLTPVSSTTDASMWWDDESTEAPTAITINHQQDDSTLARRQSADIVEQYLKAVRREAESAETTTQQAPSPTTSGRAQFGEWVEATSNADPMTAQVIGSSIETSLLPAHGPAPSVSKVNSSPPLTDRPTSTPVHTAPTSSTTSPSSVLQQLQGYLPAEHIRISQGIDDRLYFIIQDESKEEWHRDSLRVPRPPNLMQRYGLLPYDPLN
jgi:hypothetical protein